MKNAMTAPVPPKVQPKKSFFARMTHGIKNKLVSFAFVPVILANAIVAPFNGIISAAENRHKQVNAKALNTYLQVTQNVTYQPGQNHKLDSLVVAEVSSEEMQNEADKVFGGKKLSIDELFEKSDKSEFFQNAYAKIYNAVQPIKTAATPALDQTLAPIMGKSWDDIKVTSHFSKQRKMTYHKNGKKQTRQSRHLAMDAKLKVPSSKKSARRNQVGEPVYAPIDSKIIAADKKTGHILLRDKMGNRYEFYDVKLNSKVFAKGADSVKRSQQIATLAGGANGVWTGPHVHFAIYANNKAMNPEKVMKNDGYMGTIEKSPLAKQLEPELTAMIQSDPTGEKFTGLLKNEGDEYNQKITAEWVIDKALQKIRIKEGGKNDDTKTNNGLTKDAIVDMDEFKHRNVMSLDESEVDYVYKKKYIPLSGVDTLGKKLNDKDRLAKELAMIPQQLDAMINHSTDAAVEMIKRAHGNHKRLNKERIAHVRPISKISDEVKEKLYKRYNEIEKFSAEIETAMKENGGYITVQPNKKERALMEKAQKANVIVEQEEKKLFVEKLQNRTLAMNEAMDQVDRQYFLENQVQIDNVVPEKSMAANPSKELPLIAYRETRQFITEPQPLYATRKMGGFQMRFTA